ncbi:sulfotransferase [Actinoplanes sp. NPDC051851]|uniref:sulfotransferase family protein n=1 Tax=Actinoplanes sp. NPDC051851 TaxID=3154753 RepID=UPI0034200639
MSRTSSTTTPPVIVTGTGRCGSTMVSEVLARHPEVLSVSELFTTLHVPLVPGPVSGARFWELLCGMDPRMDALVRRRVPVRERHYPFGRGRFQPETGVPALCLLTLPHLTDDPDALYDELAAEVPRWAEAPVELHYRRLFDHLARLFGRRVIVERSGGSVRMLDRLLRIFPGARVVHLHRDGPDTALSMSRHPAFAIMAQNAELRRLLRGADPWETEPGPEDVAGLPDDLLEFLPSRFTPDVLERTVPLARYGRLWSMLLLEAEPQFAALPPDRLLAMGYRDLVGDPVGRLTALAAFAGFDPDPAWLSEAAATIRPGRTGTAAELPAQQRRELRRACLVGEMVLTRLGHAA